LHPLRKRSADNTSQADANYAETEPLMLPPTAEVLP